MGRVNSDKPGTYRSSEATHQCNRHESTDRTSVVVGPWESPACYDGAGLWCYGSGVGILLHSGGAVTTALGSAADEVYEECSGKRTCDGRNNDGEANDLEHSESVGFACFREIIPCLFGTSHVNTRSSLRSDEKSSSSCRGRETGIGKVRSNPG
ncbi:unnamed protein product [Camellia sinensis]